jgi:hypothetical protein
MLAAIFAIITSWAPAEAVATPAAHIADRLPALDTTGLTASQTSDARPLVSVCTYGGRSLDAFSFARLGDLARATSLPQCSSGFDAAQREALTGLTMPSGPLDPDAFSPAGWFALPTRVVALPAFRPSPSGAPSLFFAPSAHRSFAGFPTTSLTLTHASGSLGGTAAYAAGASTRVEPIGARRPQPQSRR